MDFTIIWLIQCILVGKTLKMIFSEIFVLEESEDSHGILLGFKKFYRKLIILFLH